MSASRGGLVWRAAAAAMAGIALGLGLIYPEWGWLPAVVALGSLFWIVRGTSRAGAWLVGLVSGVAVFGISSEWARLFGTHAYVALLLPLTLYWSGVLVVASLARDAYQVVLLGPSALVLSEVMRSRFPLGGYGLAMISYTQIDGPFAPLGSIVGSAGVSGISAMAGAIAVWSAVAVARKIGRGEGRRMAAAILTPFVLVSSTSLITIHRAEATLGGPQEGEPYGPKSGGSLRVAVVQVYDENRPLSEEEDASGALLGWLRDASFEAAAFGPDLIIWPEGSLGSRVVASGGVVDEAVRATTVSSGASLLANGQPLTADLDHFANRNYLFSPRGDLQDISDKEKLVPFGEYVPWRDFLEPRIGSLSKIPIDGTPGRWNLFRVEGSGVGSVICFESAFSEFVRKRVRAGAEVLIVETNNRSFGYSSLSRQHLAASRVRAIETRRYVVHAALSGISAVIGPDGSVQARAGLFERKVLVADVVPSREMTPFVKTGEVGPGMISFALVALGLLGVRRSSRTDIGGKPA